MGRAEAGRDFFRRIQDQFARIDNVGEVLASRIGRYPIILDNNDWNPNQLRESLNFIRYYLGSPQVKHDKSWKAEDAKEKIRILLAEFENDFSRTVQEEMRAGAAQHIPGKDHPKRIAWADTATSTAETSQPGISATGPSRGLIYLRYLCRHAHIYEDKRHTELKVKFSSSIRQQVFKFRKNWKQAAYAAGIFAIGVAAGVAIGMTGGLAAPVLALAAAGVIAGQQALQAGGEAARKQWTNTKNIGFAVGLDDRGRLGVPELSSGDAMEKVRTDAGSIMQKSYVHFYRAHRAIMKIEKEELTGDDRLKKIGEYEHHLEKGWRYLVPPLLVLNYAADNYTEHEKAWKHYETFFESKLEKAAGKVLDSFDKKFSRNKTEQVPSVANRIAADFDFEDKKKLMRHLAKIFDGKDPSRDPDFDLAPTRDSYTAGGRFGATLDQWLREDASQRTNEDIGEQDPLDFLSDAMRGFNESVFENMALLEWEPFLNPTYSSTMRKIKSSRRKEDKPGIAKRTRHMIRNYCDRKTTGQIGTEFFVFVVTYGIAVAMPFAFPASAGASKGGTKAAGKAAAKAGTTGAELLSKLGRKIVEKAPKTGVKVAATATKKLSAFGTHKLGVKKNLRDNELLGLRGLTERWNAAEAADPDLSDFDLSKASTYEVGDRLLPKVLYRMYKVEEALQGLTDEKWGSSSLQDIEENLIPYTKLLYSRYHHLAKLEYYLLASLAGISVLCQIGEGLTEKGKDLLREVLGLPLSEETTHQSAPAGQRERRWPGLQGMEEKSEGEIEDLADKYKRRYKINNVKGDGNCLFRAFAGAFKEARGDERSHQYFRRQAADYMRAHASDFDHITVGTQFDDLSDYLDAMESPAENADDIKRWGGGPELAALSNKFEIKIALRILERDSSFVIGENENFELTIHLLFAGGNHYKWMERRKQ